MLKKSLRTAISSSPFPPRKPVPIKYICKKCNNIWKVERRYAYHPYCRKCKSTDVMPYITHKALQEQNKK